MRRLRRVAFARFVPAIIGFAFASSAAAEPFIGQFELKTLESEPGSLEFQSQNAWSWNEPARRVATGTDGLLFDENSVARARHALELEIGLTSFFKARIGVEFEQERFDEPETLAQANEFDELKLDEIGAEIIAILKPREVSGAALGVVVEVEGPVDQEGSNHVTLGTIVEFQSGRWFAAAVPMIVHAFGGEAEDGERIDNKWDFAYAAQIEYMFSNRWSLALEGYGTVERLGNTGHPSESAQLFGDFNQHRLGPVLYFTQPFGDAPRKNLTSAPALDLDDNDDEGTNLTIGLGLLAGLNQNTPDHTLKLSIEIQF